jgi:hypothetical protein
MDPSAYSLPYVASWAGGRAPADTVRATARRVIGAAQHVLHHLDIDRGTGGQPPGITHALERSAATVLLAGSPFGSATPAIGI